MLRRTRADQVKPVFLSFTAQFQSPVDCTDRRKLRRMFAPLGLAWRANHMLETIDYLRDHYALRAPQQTESLTEIPGVGEYSNAMLRNRLFGEDLPALDVNMARLICRIVGMPFTAESRRKREVREIARALVQVRRSAELNLAVLDYCALVCKARKPLCSSCSLKKVCEFGRGRSV